MSTMEDLAAIIGDDAARALFGEAEMLTEKLERAGVEHKTDEEVAEGDGVVPQESALPAQDGNAGTGEVSVADTDVATVADVGSVAAVVDSEALWADYVVRVQGMVDAAVKGMQDAMAEKQAVVESAIAEFVGQITPTVAQLAEEVNKVSAQVEMLQKQVETLREKVDAQERVVSDAKVVWTGQVQQTRRPTQDESKGEEMSPADLEQLMKTVLTDNEAARRYYEARRKRLGL